MTAMFPVRAAVREMTIQQALEWAFATEYARIDFDELGSGEFSRGGVDNLWILGKQHQLGCRIDGGGSSDPHPDAQIIAAAVEALPIEVGGRCMATVVAELARARSVPDWGQGDRLACVPNGYEVEALGSVWSWRTSQRKTRTMRGEMCRISYEGTARAKAEKRRAYLAWYGALLHLLSVLGRDVGLTRIFLVDGMPPLSPWKSS